jgi:MATE family multidrug resistance protein
LTNTIRNEFPQLARLAGPIIVSQIAQIAAGFTDTVMAGHLGPTALGAIAVGSNLWIPVFLFCVGLLMALSSVISQLYGAGRPAEIRDLMKQALVLVGVLGLFAVLAVRTLAGLLPGLGVNPAITPIAADYARAVSWGMPAICAYLALRFLSEGIGYTRPMMLIQLLGLVLNVLFNTILMFGKLGVPAMGAVGAGWATAIVMWLNLVFLLVYAARHQRFAVIRHAQRLRTDWTRLREVVRLGIPIALTLTSEIAMFAAVALLMSRIGVTEAAAHQIAINFAAMMFMIPLGISAATTIRVGHALGQGKRAMARFRGRAGIMMASLCMLGTAGIMLSLPYVIVAIYTDDTVGATLATQLLFLAALFQMSDGIQISASGALRGIKDTLYPMLGTFVIYWIIGLPLAWYLGFTRGFGPQGLWVALIACLTLAAVWLVGRFLHLTRGWD